MAEQLVRVEVYVEGKKPYLMNPATQELLEALRTGIHEPVVKDRPRRDVAAGKICRVDDRIGVPAENLFSCLVEAGRQVDLKPRQKISTRESTQVPSFLEIEELFLSFEIEGDTDYNPETVWVDDMRRGRLPKDGTAVAIVRPRFDRWGFKVHITVDTSILKTDRVKELFLIAGRSVGLGDFRPSCRGPFGTFAVRRWTVLDEAEVEVTPAAVSVNGNGTAKKTRSRSSKRVAAAVPDSIPIKQTRRPGGRRRMAETSGV